MRLYGYCSHNGQGYYDWYSAADQEFPGDPQPVGGGTYYLAKICRKLHENEENWTERGRVCIQTFTV